ncbi:MAG TPA: hypothetical protein VGN26_18715 [Armatimonadota bacterium]|jgi:hypothetical protein
MHLRRGAVVAALLALSGVLWLWHSSSQKGINQRLRTATLLSVAAGFYASQTGHYPSRAGWTTELRPIFALISKPPATKHQDPLLTVPFKTSPQELQRMAAAALGERFALCPGMDGLPADLATAGDALFYEVDPQGSPLRRNGVTVIALAGGAGASALNRFNPKPESDERAPSVADRQPGRPSGS